MNLRIHGKMSELLELEPKLHRKHVQELAKTFFYVKLQKALYGTLCAAYLFWMRLSDQLIAWDFMNNPYEACLHTKLSMTQNSP